MKHVMLGIVLAVALAGCSESETALSRLGAAKPVPVDTAAGKAIAEKQCRGCHGLDGRSAAPGIPHLAGQRERYLVASLKEYFEGKRTHAALRGLAVQMSESDMHNVAAFYAGLPAVANGPETRAKVVLPYEAGKAKAALCAKCHGADGNSKTPGVPSFAGQQPLYFVTAIQEYLRSERKSSPMHGMLGTLTRQEKENLALYYASQTPIGRPSAPFGDPVAGEPLSAACGGCHGRNGVSNDSATPSLAAQEPRYLLQAIKAYRDTRKHPVMQRQIVALGDRDIENIVAFYVVQRSRPAEKGQRLVQDLVAKCNRCHAPDVDNPSMPIPLIAGQDKDYLVMALRAYRDDRRESSVMHRMSLPFSDTIIETLAALYATGDAKSYTEASR
jgi:cytochrome c553